MLLSVGAGLCAGTPVQQGGGEAPGDGETNCLVVREGKEDEIPMADIVPGDIVVLQAGAIIPADLRLITAKDFFVSQSSLTGESMPVEKIAGRLRHRRRGVIELPNACFQGSNVLSGTARGVVVNTGRGPISAPSPKSLPASACRPASTAASPASPG